MMMFLDKYIRRQCDFKDIYKAINFWHDDCLGGLRLIDILGLTLPEYEMFVEDEEKFKEYLYNKYHKDMFLEGCTCWDDDKVWIVEFIDWHMRNGNVDNIHFRLELSPYNMSDYDEY